MLEIRNSDRAFFTTCAIWFLLMAFAGFFDTFYLRQNFLDDYGPISTSLLVHGLIFTAWVALFAVQVTLIRFKHVSVHMAFGVAALVLLIAMLISGWYVVLEKTIDGRKSIDEGGYNLAQIGFGVVVAFIGIANFKRPFVHKRLMLAAAALLTVAAAGRALESLGFVFGWEFEIAKPLRKVFIAAPLVGLVAYDAVSLRRIPWLALLCLAVFWAVNWIYVSDLIFMRPEGEDMILWLGGLFGLELLQPPGKAAL